MNASKYFSPSRLTRSKVLSRNVRTAIRQKPAASSGKSNRKCIESENLAKQKGCKTLSSKLSRKRQHVKIKVENNCDSDSALVDACAVKKEEILQKNEEADVENLHQENVWKPPLWKQQLENVYDMRKERDAPVATMGCDVISDEKASPEVALSTLTVF